MQDSFSEICQSKEIAKLVTALAKVQGELRGYREDSNNPFFHSSYGDLSSVWAAIRRPLSDNGLAVMQPLVDDGKADGFIRVKTILAHSSGEWISGTLALRPVKPDPQAAGSAITYARRYSLAAIVGVAPEDDDGEGAMDRKSEKEEAQERIRKTAQKEAQRKADAQAPVQPPPEPAKESALSALYREARSHDMKDDEWRSVLDAIGLKSDKRTHTTERLARLRQELDTWIAAYGKKTA